MEDVPTITPSTLRTVKSMSELFDLDTAVERHLRVHGSLPRRLALLQAEEIERLRAGITEAMLFTDSGGECGQRLYNLLHLPSLVRQAQGGDDVVSEKDGL